MNAVRAYRNALQASPRRIAQLDDADLNELVRELLSAQASRCGCADASVNTDPNASDAGCDGWSARPATEDRWLGNTDTCWQFKAGKTGEPAKLRGEVTKPMSRQTLQGRRLTPASPAVEPLATRH